MKIKFRSFVVSLLLLSAVFSGISYAGDRVIKKLTVNGNVTLNDEAVLYYTGFEVGDTYTDKKARKNFNRLWERGIFDYVSIEVEDFKDGVEVIINVKETPIIKNMDIRGNENVGESKIKDALKKNNVEFKENTYLDRADVIKAKSIIEEFLSTKGYKYARVNSKIMSVSRTESSLVFDIDLGNKIKIKKITVKGNKTFSDSKIKRKMKNTSETWMFSWITRNNVHSERELQKDLQKVTKLYKNNGYVNVNISEPEVEIKEEKEDEDSDKRWAYITFRVEEGKKYKIGSIDTKGNEVFEKGKLLKWIKLGRGDLYKENTIQQGIKKINNMYGNKGYLYSQTSISTKTHPSSKIVDVTLDVYEGKKYYLGRLEFAGNTQTKDRVLRREVRIPEGGLFRKKLFERSLRKINQLGYFKVNQFPEIKPIDDTNKLRVTIKGEEKGKNQIELGGGYSDLEGAFVRGSYSTKNFLGRGEILSFSAEVGGKRNQYSIKFREPWIFGRQYSLGGNLYRRETEYLEFDQKQTGFGLNFGFPLSFFAQGSLNYSYNESEIISDKYDYNTGSSTYLRSRQTTEYTISEFTPVFSYDSTNDPFSPSKGLKIIGKIPVAGGILGGDTNYYRPKLTASWYHSMIKSSYFGINGEIGYVSGFGDKILPIDQYYYEGGDRSIRGYEAQSIYPRWYDEKSGQWIPFLNENNSPKGGDKYLQFNAEAVYPFTGKFKLVGFFDAGNTYLGSYDPTDLYYSCGVELRVTVPMFQYPLRLIYAEPINPEEYHETKNFIFSIGTTF